jgi:hypothetical protein
MTSSKRLGGFVPRCEGNGAWGYKLTGKPLGVTGDIAEYEAARFLRLNLALMPIGPNLLPDLASPLMAG